MGCRGLIKVLSLLGIYVYIYIYTYIHISRVQVARKRHESVEVSDEEGRGRSVCFHAYLQLNTFRFCDCLSGGQHSRSIRLVVGWPALATVERCRGILI